MTNQSPNLDNYKIFDEQDLKEDYFDKTAPLSVIKNELNALKSSMGNKEHRLKELESRLLAIKKIIDLNWSKVNDLPSDKDKVNFLNNLIASINKGVII